MERDSLTIGRLAEASSVGVETVRYYERRGLLPQPRRPLAAYRQYDKSHVSRIRFIKRAQELGFSLAEVETLLALDDGAGRKTIREVAGLRLAQIRERICDLRRMEKALAHVLAECERRSGAPHCPIIAAISGDGARLAMPGRRGRNSLPANRTPAMRDGHG